MCVMRLGNLQHVFLRPDMMAARNNDNVVAPTCILIIFASTASSVSATSICRVLLPLALFIQRLGQKHMGRYLCYGTDAAN